jgi:hypothetical protein
LDNQLVYQGQEHWVVEFISHDAVKFGDDTKKDELYFVPATYKGAGSTWYSNYEPAYMELLFGKHAPTAMLLRKAHLQEE